jgi:DNA repair protein SbcC/Rad50
MRPLRLSVEGFTSFRAPTTIDFDGTDYFALVGPTGAGKSSLIDAIAFALYGCVPRYDDRRLVAPVISQGRVEARVGLDFVAGGAAYRAARVVRASARGKGATTKEARLERLASEAPDAVVEEILAGDADAMNDTVARLLGLSFEHFTKCVVLPQGEFARFLLDKPAARQDLLAELLGFRIYDAVGQRANQESTALLNRVALAEQELARPALAGATAESVAQTERDVVALETVRSELDGRLGELARLDHARAEADGAALAAQDRARSLGELTVPRSVAALSSDLDAARQATDAARRASADAAQALVDAETARQQLPDKSLVEGAVQAHTERDDVVARIEKGQRVMVDLRDADSAARAELEQAERHLAAARRARDEAFVADQAAALAGHLVAGQPCPVCQQKVSRLPPPSDVAGLDAAEAALAAGEESLAAASRAATEAGRRTAKGEETLRSLQEQLAALDGRVASFPDQAGARARLAEILAADAAVLDARNRERATRRALDEAEARVAALTGSSTAAWAAFDETRDRLVSLGPPPVPRDDLAAAWTALVAWAGDRRPEAEAEAAEAAIRRERLASERDRVAVAVVDHCASVGVSITDALGATEAVAAALASARSRVDAHREALVHADELRLQIGRDTSDAQVAKALGQHLRSTGFEQWLLDDILAGLVRAATGVLIDLSSGAYSLTMDASGGFGVVDHRNAGAIRSARTLSGGETFLASLALALALADRLAEYATEGSAKLEAIFLDEGFGTLDAETLDTVAAAIENLAASGRVVGLVTHVRELAERVPVRFEVERGPTTSVVKRVEG